MRMTLYRRRGVYWSKIMHRGTLLRRSMQAANRTDAIKREAAFRRQLHDEDFGLRQQAPTVQDFTKQFMDYLPSHVKAQTVETYKDAWQHILNFEPLATCRLDRVNGALLTKFATHRATQGAKPATINTGLRVLSRALQLAKEWLVILYTPTIHMVRGEKARDFVISETDEKALVEGCPNKTVKLLIPFLIETGLRISEACALSWSQVGETSVTVKDGKTRSAVRTVPLTVRATKILAALPRNGDPVFTGKRGIARMTPSRAGYFFRVGRAKAGLPNECVIHSCRHTFCTRLGKSGASPYELQRLAGHGSIIISARYCHPDTEQLTNAINRLNK